MSTTTRLCGPLCLFPDEAHLEPEPDWIGNTPVMHGESDRKHPDPGTVIDMGGGFTYRMRRDSYCLCGHPEYFTCPAWLDGGGLAGLVIERGRNWTAADGEVSS